MFLKLFFNSEYTFGEVLSLINFIIIAFFMVLYIHHQFFTIMSIFIRAKKYPKTKNKHKYGYLICARNEEKVIGNLIDSILNQNYPKELIKIFVIADNCDDNTALIAREKGAITLERTNKEFVGKGFALNVLLQEAIKDTSIDGYFVFDADNLLEPNYTEEMNKAFDQGRPLLTSYRNSKNYGQNWLASGAGLLFARECRIMHRCRSGFNTGCYVSGTGFLADRKIFEENKGWIHHSLIEDIEFSIYEVLQGYKTDYVERAIFYDEHPTKFKDSINQRMRWCKGTHQCFARYEGKLIKNFFKKGRFINIDLGTHVFPAPMISFCWLILLPIIYGIYAYFRKIPFDFYYTAALKPFVDAMIYMYLYTFVIGGLVTLFEWRRLKAKWYKKILHIFTFPLYMMMYLPITTISFFKKVKWKHISHDIDSTIEDLK